MGDIIKSNKGNVVKDSNNITIGNTTISSAGPSNQQQSGEKAALAVQHLKALIAEDKPEKCLEGLKLFFQKEDNKSALNTAVMFFSKLREIEERVNLSLISRDQYSLDKAKVNAGILNLIDNEITP